MGLIQSVFCSMTFCVERVLTWACCAFVLMLLMFAIVILMIYGISVGYHYAQKELAAFAMSSRSTTEDTMLLRGGPVDSRPVVRLVAVNQTEVEHAPEPILEVYQTRKPGEQIYLETTETPVVLLETESRPPKGFCSNRGNAETRCPTQPPGPDILAFPRPPKEPDFSPRERELARRLIGRFRRSRSNVTSTVIPFLRPLRTTIRSSTNYNTRDPVSVHQNLTTV